MDKNIDEKILDKATELRIKLGEDLHDHVMESIYSEAAKISEESVERKDGKKIDNFDKKIDKIVTGKYTGFPLMFILLAFVFWLTIVGTNIPSQFLSSILVDKGHPFFKTIFNILGVPYWITGLLVDGAYLAGAWVISVMFPPMAIFFPLFTLAEDLGYLPRVAFNMDNLFRRAGAHGKQALTMTMGFGCNAAGVVATRIIDSPRERLIAIITNNFSLCNGRWPTQILIATIFIGGVVPSYLAGLASAAAVVFVALLGIFLSLIVSFMLSKTVLKGEASAFVLELPPYRPPRILQTLYTSLIDRTIFVLWRAVLFAVPSGMVIWLVANINIQGVSFAEFFIRNVDPFALFFGLNGVIFLAYIIAIPANEIVLPTILMLTIMTSNIAGGSGNGVLMNADSADVTANILKAGGWTLLTGINLMLFSLVHNPCSTTIYTIYKETKSLKWTLVSTFLPIVMGLTITFFTTQIYKMLMGN